MLTWRLPFADGVLQEVRGCNYIWEQVLHVQESFTDDSPPRAAQGPGEHQQLLLRRRHVHCMQCAAFEQGAP